MSFSIKLGNFLFKKAYRIYKPLYVAFKNRQDKYEISLIKNNIRPGDVILDIGANIGYYTKILSKLVGAKGKVHAFEPDPVNYERLLQNCGQLKNVVLNNKAIGPKTEKIKIYTSKTLNVDHRTYKPEEYEAEIEIEAVKADEYMGRVKVDFIKMDIQGFEMSAIQGMENILRSNSEIRILSEFWPYGLKLTGSSASEYYNYLSSLNFSCFLLEDDRLIKLNEEKVKEMDSMKEELYFNIFAKKELN